MAFHRENFSRLERRLDVLRHKAGFLLGPLVFVILWFLPVAGLADNVAAHRLLAVLGLVVVLWVTEAIPLPATALLGPALCVVAGVGGAKATLASFANPIIFVFLGGFLLAEGMLHHGLNRRIAFTVLGWRWAGTNPIRLLLVFGGVTGLFSMWVSNTATTAMMFPIGLAVLSGTQGGDSAPEAGGDGARGLQFGTALMLMIAFAASLGGLATPVGTPPNLIGIGLIEKNLGRHIRFFEWMTFAAPLAVVLIIFLVAYLGFACRHNAGWLGKGRTWLEAEKANLGPWRRGEINVLAAFLFTVFLWIMPGIVGLVRGANDPFWLWLDEHVPESIAAVLGAMLLFLLPVDWENRVFTLSWKEAQRIDWGTILLFGGGLALGGLMFSTGLAQWMGEGLAHALNAQKTLGLVALFTAVAIVVSETTSNTASATMVVPVAIAVAQAGGVNPLQPALAACLGSSMGFMLPVSTPPNAIVYGSGCIPLLKMVRYGALLDAVGFVVITVAVTWVIPGLLG